LQEFAEWFPTISDIELEQFLTWNGFYYFLNMILVNVDCELLIMLPTIKCAFQYQSAIHAASFPFERIRIVST